MANSILDHITEKYNSLTPSEKKLSNYILTHSSEVQYMSIHSLSKFSHVSEATITRFCRTLGLPSYQSLKISLAKIDNASNLKNQSDFLSDSKSQDSLKTAVGQIYDSYITSLNETIDQLEFASFNEAVDLLSAAKHVYCFGQGGSMVIAMEAWARFSVSSSSFIHIADSHLQIIAASLATPEDVILYFSYSGATKEFQDLARIVEKRSVPVILVTHFRNSAAAKTAKVTLFCGYNENPLLSGSIAAKMGQLLLIDCLYTAYCEKNPQTQEATSFAADAMAQKHL